DGSRHLLPGRQRQRQRRGPATGTGRPLRPPRKSARLLDGVPTIWGRGGGAGGLALFCGAPAGAAAAHQVSS
nr:hypothetical protein [Tanacetum cinerariifolium]